MQSYSTDNIHQETQKATPSGIVDKGLEPD